MRDVKWSRETTLVSSFHAINTRVKHTEERVTDVLRDLCSNFARLGKLRQLTAQHAFKLYGEQTTLSPRSIIVPDRLNKTRTTNGARDRRPEDRPEYTLPPPQILLWQRRKSLNNLNRFITYYVFTSGLLRRPTLDFVNKRRGINTADDDDRLLRNE